MYCCKLCNAKQSVVCSQCVEDLITQGKHDCIQFEGKRDTKSNIEYKLYQVDIVQETYKCNHHKTIHEKAKINRRQGNIEMKRLFEVLDINFNIEDDNITISDILINSKASLEHLHASLPADIFNHVMSTIFLVLQGYERIESLSIAQYDLEKISLITVTHGQFVLHADHCTFDDLVMLTKFLQFVFQNEIKSIRDILDAVC